MVLKPKKIKSVTASTNMGTTQKEILYMCVCVCVCVCVYGLPWWLSGIESVWQHRRYRLDTALMVSNCSGGEDP